MWSCSPIGFWATCCGSMQIRRRIRVTAPTNISSALHTYQVMCIPYPSSVPTPQTFVAEKTTLVVTPKKRRFICRSACSSHPFKIVMTNISQSVTNFLAGAEAQGAHSPSWGSLSHMCDKFLIDEHEVVVGLNSDHHFQTGLIGGAVWGVVQRPGI